MRIQRIYLDTSVFGGAFDEEFEKATNMLFAKINQGLFKPVISYFIEEEIKLAPETVRAFFEETLPITEIVELTPEAIDLQEEYLKSGIVSVKSEIDALHVALATVTNCSMIVSWNFKHIVHYQKIPLYNGINQAKGYRSIGIYSPLEVINDEQ